MVQNPCVEDPRTTKKLENQQSFEILVSQILDLVMLSTVLHVHRSERNRKMSLYRNTQILDLVVLSTVLHVHRSEKNRKMSLYRNDVIESS